MKMTLLAAVAALALAGPAVAGGGLNGSIFGGNWGANALSHSGATSGAASGAIGNGAGFVATGGGSWNQSGAGVMAGPGSVDTSTYSFGGSNSGTLSLGNAMGGTVTGSTGVGNAAGQVGGRFFGFGFGFGQ
jgi:hypothetical protein